MSVRIFHAKGTSNVTYSSINKSYSLKYPCENPSECSQYTISFSPGIYVLEAWGSQGGDSIGYTGKGGKGGYSIGVFKTNKRKNLYLHIGAYSTNSYGYNGGADSYNTHDGRGGGATDFRTVSGNWDQNFESRIIVAGGGGGAYTSKNGGRGGGLEGESLTTGSYRACYGSQDGCIGGNGDKPGTFGKGGGPGAGTGGGGYWGGGGSASGSSGGGGSGYIGGVESLPYILKQTSMSDHSGYGEAKITILMNYNRCTYKRNNSHFILSFIMCMVYK